VTSKPDFKVMVLLLVFMQLTRDLFAIAKFLFTMQKYVLCNFRHLIIIKLQKIQENIVRQKDFCACDTWPMVVSATIARF